jgi:hypothetical protein
MKRIFLTSQIVGNCRIESQDLEACATAEALYDEEQSQLIIELDSFLRPADIRFKEEHLPADFLPEKETFKESVSQDEAPELARDIFQRWVRTVRQSVTSMVHD